MLYSESKVEVLRNLGGKLGCKNDTRLINKCQVGGKNTVKGGNAPVPSLNAQRKVCRVRLEKKLCILHSTVAMLARVKHKVLSHSYTYVCYHATHVTACDLCVCVLAHPHNYGGHVTSFWQ